MPSDKKYYQQNKEKYKAINKKYAQSAKGKVATKRYQQSEKGKNVRRKINQTEKSKIRKKRYQQSIKGKFIDYKTKARRRQNLGFIQMFNNPFDEHIEWHHITDAIVIAIPDDIHRQYLGKYHRENTMEIVKQIYLDGE